MHYSILSHFAYKRLFQSVKMHYVRLVRRVFKANTHYVLVFGDFSKPEYIISTFNDTTHYGGE